jgi:large subunit ribosomal protein L29
VRAKEIRERSDEELARMLEENKSQLFQLRLKNSTHQLDDLSQIGSTRREVARIMTVMAERGSLKPNDAIDAKVSEE